MKEKLKKISAVMKKIFGYGIFVSLVAGGLVFFGYVVALIIGGETAAAICDFIKVEVLPVLFYYTSAFVLFGLLAMYLGGEAALSASKRKKPNKKTENTDKS